MDHAGAIPTEGDWTSHSLGGMFTGDQETDSIMIQLLESYPMISDLAILDGSWPGNEESTLMDISRNHGPNCSLKTTNSSHLTGSSQETDLIPTSSDGYRFYNFSGSPSPTTLVTKNFHSNGNYLSTAGFCAADVENSSLCLIQGEAYVSIHGNMEEPGRYQCEELAASNHYSRNTGPKGKSVKRSKVPENDQMYKRSRKQSKKSCYNEEAKDENHMDIAPQLQPSGGMMMSRSEAAALNSSLNGKTRATRGSATDAQSIYARRRREGINNRLRVLQNLVPNGRKVDISTMLEEAVNYVKFLQLQIKMLSSDDMWMYAPICYNAMLFGSDGDESCHAKSLSEVNRS